jgi:TPR repeat protein
MFTLSTWWAQGRGGPEDDAVALKWCEDAAFAGLPRAQFNAGCALLAGKGTPNGRPNHAAAAEWFRLAAERGMPEACVNLGEMCRLGLGTAGPPDYVAAKRWHARARDLGSGFAAELLEDDRNFMDDDAAAAAAK